MMPAGARRLLMLPWRRCVRRALPMLCLWIAGLLAPSHAIAAPVCVTGDGAHIRKVCLSEEPGAPTYGHDILGDTPEWDAVTVFWGPKGRAKSDGRRGAATLLQAGHIFEDITPRLVDLDGDGLPEILLVQSSLQLGGRLVVLGTDGALSLVAATPYIGRARRWLAPIGATDLDGDGKTEIAYIDRPHLAKTLRIWRYDNGTLTHVADQPGLTNHRIGDAFITGGLRDCGQGPEMITANADWSQVIVTRLTGDKATSRALSAFSSAAVATAIACKS